MSTHPSRAQEVASTLRTEILRERFRMGERLPSERDLSARFNTNRGAIREALKQLEQLGIISIQPGGARVLPIEEATLEVLGHLLNLDKYPDPKLVDQFLLVFKVFCVMSAEGAIEKASDSELTIIEQCAADLKSKVGDTEAMRAGWTDLFNHFFTINDNLVMRLIANGLKVQLIERSTNMELKPTVDQQHLRNIIEDLHGAIQVRDVEQLGRTVANYFELVREAMATAYVHLRSSATQTTALENSIEISSAMQGIKP